MSNRLSGKVCIVTGTRGGIGREAALTFAREGALVVGCGLFTEEAEATVAAVRAADGTMVSTHRYPVLSSACSDRIYP
jgi:NAD(P)-dependent dehydrogenase (short-subunit alcohol dehydrogenase family)